MRNFHNAIITGPFGLLKIVSRKEFLSEIPVKEWFRNETSVNVAFKTAPDIYGSTPDILPSWRTRTFFLDRDQVLSTDFYDHESIEEYPKYDMLEMIYDMTTKSAYEMGNPTHLVRLDKRVWMAANPEDFIIFANNMGQRLVNYRPKKSIYWKITK
jgi:hypothetical protein